MFLLQVWYLKFFSTHQPVLIKGEMLREETYSDKDSSLSGDFTFLAGTLGGASRGWVETAFFEFQFLEVNIHLG